MKNKGILYVISGPSGVGKGTICKKLIENNPNVTVSVSATTRKPREEDTEGVTYFFKTKEDFERMIEDGEFLEWAKYNENYYGTPKAPVLEHLESGRDVILEIEVQGGVKVIEGDIPVVSVFIAPPSKETLFERLRGRGSESEEEIKKRVAAAEYELSQRSKYKYTVINDLLDDAVRQIEDIMKKERNVL